MQPSKLLFVGALLWIASTVVRAGNYDGTTTATDNWAAGTHWDATPVSDLDTVLNYTSTLAAGVAIISNNDVISPPFKLNRLNFTNISPGTGTAPTLTLTGNQLEFVTNTALATPTLVFNTLSTVKPTIDIQNNFLLTNPLGVTATTDGKLSGVISGGGSLTKTGAGALTLSAANNFSGGLILNGGTLSSGAGTTAIDALGAAGGVVTVNSASTLDMAGPTFAATTLAKSFVLNANLTFGPPGNAGNGANITGAVSGTGSISSLGVGNLSLRPITLASLANTFTGAILGSQNGNYTVNSLSDAVGSGNIFLGANGGPGKFTWGAGAVSSLTLNNRQIEMSGPVGCGAIVNNANATAGNIVTINSNLGVSVAGAKTVTLGGANAGANLFAGIIADGVSPSAVISVTKADAGKWILSGANSYSGDTTISAGSLSLSNPNPNNNSSTVTIAAAATLNLNFSGTDSVRKLIIGANPMAAGIYKAASNPAPGIAIPQITGTGTLTVIGITLGIGDSMNGRLLVGANATVTYTLTFSEDMDASTVSAADFDNAGTSTISIGTITRISPGVFTILVTPTSLGTLRLQVIAGAVLKDVAGNAMITTSAIPDDTTITVYQPQSEATSPASRGISPVANKSGSILSIEMPPGVVAGDLLIANIAQYGSSLGNPTSSGWTLISGKSLGGTVGRYGAVLYKVATAIETSTYEFTFTGNAQVAAGVIMAFSSVDTIGGPFDATPSSLYTGTTTTTAVGPAAQITTVTPNARVLMLGMAGGKNSLTWSNWSTTSPGTLAEDYDAQGSGTNAYATSFGAASAVKAVPGATGTGSATLSSNVSNGSILLALKPSYNSALLTALAELKSHINGTITLSAAQIDAHKLTIDAQKSLFGSSPSAIVAALDLVATYDSVVGPLWVAQNGFTRATVTNDIPWTICTVMQNIMDWTYTAANIANHSDLLDGFKFGSSAYFPGACAPPADPELTNTAVINANFPDTRGWPTWGETPFATKPTGNYLAPGSIATVTVPASMVGRGYKIRVGCHTADLSGKPTVLRLDRVSLLYPINATETRVANPLGGGIYIAVPAYVTDVGIVNIQITNAVRSPYFSAKSFHTTTPAQWLSERANPAPWADFQSEKYMMQVPTSWISAMPDPTQLMKDWDIAADTCNDLMGFPHDRGKETMYDQVDINLRQSVYNPGYPTNNNTYSPSGSYGGYADSYLVRGPQVAPDWHFHEQGHAYYFTQLPGEIESAINILHVAVWNQRFGYSPNDAFGASSQTGHTAYATLDTTATAWMMCDNFVDGIAMQQAEKQYQLKGHAKFVDVARMFGWDKLNLYHYSYTSDYETTGTRGTHDIDSQLLRLSKSVGVDIRPLFDFWGVPPVNNTTLGSAIASANLQPSAAIYNTLVHYKSLIPADRTTFQTFALNWWERQPLLTGGTEENNHAKRWDTYNSATAADTQARMQATIDLYFPNGNPAPPPTLASSAISDDKSGGAVTVNTPVTYTLTFSKDMDAGTVSTDDFGNAGTAAVTIGTVSETTPGVFTLQATPTSTGSLQLRVNAGAVINDVEGIALITTNPISDDTVLTVNAITVQTPYQAWSTGTFINSFFDQAPTSNPDGDSLTNLQEYAFGTDPTVPASGPITYVPGGDVITPGSPVLNLATNGGVDYRAVFGRRKNHLAAGLNYIVEFSAGLGVWVISTASPTVLTGADSVGEIEAVSVPFPLSIPVQGDFQKPTFVRVGVSGN